jgi:hypothetical protein
MGARRIGRLDGASSARSEHAEPIGSVKCADAGSDRRASVRDSTDVLARGHARPSTDVRTVSLAR